MKPRCLLLVCGVLVVGCGGGDQATTASTGTTMGGSGDEGEGMSVTGGGLSDATGAPTTGTPTAGSSTVLFEADHGPFEGCDVFSQDCPPGSKCSAFADDGGTSWNSAKCVPVMEDAAGPGEPCAVEGDAFSGIDDCELGAYCWDVDPASNTGVCVALCTGSPEAPECADPETTCALLSLGSLNLCLDRCDPLQQDCPSADDLCLASPSGGGFLCVFDASGEEGQQHDPCMFVNSCDSGLVCLNSVAADECDPDSPGCCEPFCDLAAADADAVCWAADMGVDNGQDCVPFFEMGAAPMGYEDVGVCAVPM